VYHLFKGVKIMAVAKLKKKKKTVGDWLYERIQPPKGKARNRIDPAIERGVKKAGTWLRKKLIPASSKVPGQMDYPAISKVHEAEKKRRKMLEEMEL
jgi:hypothetical protein